VTKKKKLFSFSFAIIATLEGPLLSIPSIDDGCNDKNKEHLDDSNSLSNIGTKMNDISLIPSLLFCFHQEFLTLVSSQCISLFVCLWLFFKILSRLFSLHSNQTILKNLFCQMPSSSYLIHSLRSHYHKMSW
jgi:hypothetical protein